MEIGLIERPPKEILRYLIIEHYHNVLNALETHYKVFDQSKSYVHKGLIKGKIKTFYYRVRQSLSKEDQTKVLEFMSGDTNKYIEGFYFLTDKLYDMGILDFLDSKTYDPSSAHEEDEAKEL